MKNAMIKLIYPRKAQALFTNRVTELEIIESYKDRLMRGEANKIAFIGTRRIGKSTILYEFIKRNLNNHRLFLAYVNLQRLVMEPLSFARSYIGLITKWAVKDAADNFARYDDPQFCLRQLQKRHPKTLEYLDEFLAIMQNREIPLARAFEHALNFPKILSKATNKPIILMLDEFQEITLLKNFKQLPEILGLMRDVMQTHDDVLYVFASSYVRLMQNIIDSPASPFFGQINPYYLSSFGRDDSQQFLKRISRQLQLGFPPAAGKKLIELTAGHPFYLELLANALHEAQRIDGIEPKEDNVLKVLILNLVNEKSPLNLHLRYIYEDALGRARGSAILHGILRVLAKDDSLTLTEIANRLSRKVGLIQLGLRELSKVDLVIRKDKYYFINDRLLHWWIYFKFYHPEGAFSLHDKIVHELSDHFREKFFQVTAELGRAKEYELYYFVSKMQGKNVRGVMLPEFKTLIKNYVLPNGDEIDLFARNKESWVFELKWKNKLVGMNEWQKLKEKIQVDRYVLISKKGFTKALMDYAKNSPEVILWGAEVMSVA
jgi:AAA+ ATPase superfamily predicted ATPase